ncbi:MAG: helix-turn-helix domain-containing protein [Ferruginibacter sp.]|nr:helix-turn-helix domain-containing protein [Bacteroidota bacterium]MBX2920184.1 helix-turn-helix domain-containing protein [Ferruginibacter sp.]
MAVNLITQEDLQAFKTELFAELKNLFTQVGHSPQKKWLKSYEVREILSISRGTLQNLKDNGTLHPTLVGGLLFYDHDEITKLLQGNKQSKR